MVFRHRARVLAIGGLLGLLQSAHPAMAQQPPRNADAAASLLGNWRIVPVHGELVPREEAGFVAVGGKFFLVGGRGMNPVDIYDPKTSSWTRGAVPPVEIHHFQPVEYGGRIYVINAMTGPYPDETPIPYVLIYDPAKDQWSKGPEIPAARRRGCSGLVVRGGKIYVVAGILHGHMSGFVPWADIFDPHTGRWQILPDAPHARDHFQAAIVGDKLYAAGGRRSSGATKQVFDLTVAPVDVFDFRSGKWSVLAHDLPVPSAGGMTAAVGGSLLVIGGESMAQTAAHSEVQAYDTVSGRWQQLPPLAQGSHGTGAIVSHGQVFIASGAGNRGGSPVLPTLQSAPLLRK
ncbi:MAG TPA: hypothetical protein VNT42_01010 [Sphingomonas sp.]|nr:hypothetical protein [Sphingomonas sp.]